MKRLLQAAAVLALIAAVLILFSMPAARLVLPTSSTDGTVRGILHIHTNRSDGRNSPEEIAAIAARAGVKFLVFTDHGDGTRPPDPPAYRSGVLCIDGVEVSTDGGHYVAIGMPASPYPLGGEARDVVEDVRRLGGIGIAAHPDSPKAELRWEEWDAPIDGMEIVNPDSAWRSWILRAGLRPKFTLLRALGTYQVRAPETIAGLFERDPPVLRTWMSLAADRRVVGVGGVDAHAKLALWDVEPGDNAFTLPFPGYRAAFETLSVHVDPGRPLSGDAAADAVAILGGLRAGHLYTSIDGLAGPAVFEFHASNENGRATAGDEVRGSGPLSLSVSSNAPAGSTTTIFHGSTIVSEAQGTETTVPGSPGAYRVEIRLPGPRAPLWIISNPIYVRDHASVGPSFSSGARPAETPDRAEASAKAGGPTDVRPTAAADILFPAPVLGWSIEHDQTSRADLLASGSAMIFRYTLGKDAAVHPRVALVAVPHPVPPNTRVSLTTRASHPMRISVQLRTGANGTPEERWQRSVYVDTEAREQTIAFDDFRPVGTARTEEPPLAANPSLLFVIETTNTKPGTTGELTISRVALQR